MADVVKVLRGMKLPGGFNQEALHEAAAEIERLRAEAEVSKAAVSPDWRGHERAQDGKIA